MLGETYWAPPSLLMSPNIWATNHLIRLTREHTSLFSAQFSIPPGAETVTILAILDEYELPEDNIYELFSWIGCCSQPLPSSFQDATPALVEPCTLVDAALATRPSGLVSNGTRLFSAGPATGATVNLK